MLCLSEKINALTGSCLFCGALTLTLKFEQCNSLYRDSPSSLQALARPARLPRRNLPLRFKHARRRLKARSDAARRQRREEESTVAGGAQARVEDGDEAAVGRRADEAAHALLQCDDGLRHAVLVEARPALLFDEALARGDDRSEEQTSEL